MPPNTVKVDRSTPFGNNWIVGKYSWRLGRAVETTAEAVEEFRQTTQDPRCSNLIAHFKTNLRGKNLACWCKIFVCNQCGAQPENEDECEDGWDCECGGTFRRQPCHADVLLELANL